MMDPIESRSCSRCKGTYSSEHFRPKKGTRPTQWCVACRDAHSVVMVRYSAEKRTLQLIEYRPVRAKGRHHCQRCLQVPGNMLTAHLNIGVGVYIAQTLQRWRMCAHDEGGYSAKIVFYAGRGMSLILPRLFPRCFLQCPGVLQ